MSTPSPGLKSSDSLQEFLKRWGWFLTLPETLRQLVLETACIRSATAGEYIARAGEPSAHWYGLIHGFLQMYVLGSSGGETTLHCMREGEWGGEGSLLKKELRRYDLRSLTASRLCLIPAQTFEVLRQTSIEFNQFLCDNMNERMGKFVGMLEASRLRSPETRLAQALLMLADHKVDGAQPLLIPQQELALICGLSRQRVNAAISEFKRQGLVRSESQKGALIVKVQDLRSYVMTEA